MEMMLQLKLDGLTCVLYYKNGQLIHAASRGDGHEGEDWLTNVMRIQNVKSNLPGFSGSLRGEIIVTLDSFNQYFKPKGFKNPRNTASGQIRDMSVSNESLANMKILYFDIINDSCEFETENSKIETIENFDLETVQHEILSHQEVWNRYKEIENTRDSLNFWVDGVVVKANKIDIQKRAGVHDLRPKGQKCIKFEALTGESTVRKIILSHGHTGQIIPTAEYDPIDIEGRTFKHALLDNFDIVETLGIGINARVKIAICGDIIPKIIAVLEPPEEVFPRPTACPVCNAPTEIDGAKTVCTGMSCSAKSIGKVNNWIKKTGIKYIGESRQRDLFEAGVVVKPADLYTVTQEQVGEVIGGGNASNAMLEIDKYRILPLHTFMGALGIKFLGRSNAKKLIKAGIDSLYKFMTFDPEVEKERIDGFGDNLKEIANGVENCKDTINSLIEAGVNITEPTQTETSQSQSEGMEESLSYCFTGVRLGALKDAFEAKGWIEKSGVSGNLNYLVAKDPTSTSGKAKKARDKGVNIISLAQFEEMLGE